MIVPKPSVDESGINVSARQTSRSKELTYMIFARIAPVSIVLLKNMNHPQATVMLSVTGRSVFS